MADEIIIMCGGEARTVRLVVLFNVEMSEQLYFIVDQDIADIRCVIVGAPNDEVRTRCIKITYAASRYLGASTEHSKLV